jgi:hypothetical protein
MLREGFGTILGCDRGSTRPSDQWWTLEDLV